MQGITVTSKPMQATVGAMLLENRLQDTQLALQDAQNKAVNAEQSAYLLNVMGKWVANAPATA